MYNSSLEDATKLKFAPFCCSSDTLANEIILGQSQNIHFQPNNHYSPWFYFWESKKVSKKRMPLERASQGEQNGRNFSFVAYSCEELLVFKVF